MKIGISGAPQVGKSTFARDLRGKLATNHLVLDDYIPALEMELDIKLDTETLYLPNLILAMWREKYERELFVHDDDYITVGTVLDTLVYVAINAERFAALPQEYQTVETRGQAVMEMTSAQTLSFVLMDTLRKYDVIFYLPPSVRKKILVPGATPEPEVPNQELIDSGLKTFIAKYRLPVVELTGSDEQKLSTAIEFLRGKGANVSSESSDSGDTSADTGESVSSVD